MKILLINDNPVVNKLVTLSAQKTSDELDIAESIEDITDSSYDLIVVDDSIGGDELLEQLKSKVRFVKSLYICARDAKESTAFDSVLKKPFLPTDLVELFAVYDKKIEKELAAVDSESLEDDMIPEIDNSHDTLDNIDDLGELDSFEDVSLDDAVNLDMEELELDTLEGNDVLALDDEILDDASLHESVLDDEEAQKVKDLLDETEEGELDFDMALDLEDEGDVDIDGEDSVEKIEDLQLDENLDFDMALDLEDEADVDISEDEDDQLLGVDDVMETEDETTDTEVEEADEDEHVDEIESFESFEEPEVLEEEKAEKKEEDVVEEENLVEDDTETELSDTAELEQQIQEAVEDLSQEDLESELDDETLLDIAASEIDSLDKLSSKDLKLALGEEVDENDLETEEDVTSEDVAELLEESEAAVKKEPEHESIEGVAALKKLLKALDDKDVAASMKGMKITINIELGVE